jgi:KaiC/GvpD/RAD55 family RecA-like ATPase
MPLTTTGISGLDAQLGGGVPLGSTILLVAQPGNAQTVFAEQFAGGGLDAGEACDFFELDRPVLGLREAIGAYVHNGKKAQLRLFDGYSTQFGRPLPGSPDAMPILPKDALGDILRTVGEGGRGPRRVVIESLSSLVTPDSQAGVVDFVRNLAFLGRELDLVQLVVVVRGLHDPAFETWLKHVATGVFEIGAEQKGFGVYSYLFVSKLAGVADPVRMLLFKETDKGLWLESTKRVF